MKRDVQLQRAIEILKASRILDKTEADREGRLERRRIPAGDRRRPGPGARSAGRLTTARMLVLGIESSCDETAAAVLDGGRKVLSSIVASQDDVHAPLRRRRARARLAPASRGRASRSSRARSRRGVGLPDLDGIAVTQGPGLVGSLLVGLRRGQGHRLRPPAAAGGRESPGRAHLRRRLAARAAELPFLALVVSRAATPRSMSRARRAVTAWSARRATTPPARPSTRSRSSSGSGIPAAPSSSASRAGGRPEGDRVSRSPRSSDGAPDFSFAGLKTAVSLYVRRRGPLGPRPSPTCARRSRRRR